jgi:thioredoxin 1
MATTTVEVTKDGFEALLGRDGIVLIDWWAPWCAPCRAFAPTYERVAEKHPDVVFAKVNTEQEPELAAALEIRSIPTLMVLRDRVLLFAQAGVLPEAALEDVLRQARAVDMEDVRARLAAEQAAGGYATKTSE